MCKCPGASIMWMSSVTHAKYPSLTETGVQDRKSDWVQAQ
eukprot:gene18143-5741_t